MSEHATKDDVQVIVDRAVNKAVDDLSEIIQTFATNVDERFDKIEQRLDKVEQRVDKIEQRLDKVEQNMERLTNTLDAFLKRLDDIEIDNTARDAQLARLERWIEQIAAKTGTKLEY